MSHEPRPMVEDRKTIKCVVVGDHAAGKSSLLKSYTTQTFPPEDVPVLHETTTVNVMVDGGEHTLALWDTTGDQNYSRTRPLWYPQADVFVICFSVDAPESFDNVSYRWIPEIRHLCPGVPCLIVGTKFDLRDHQPLAFQLRARLPHVQYKEAFDKVKALGCTYTECSSLTGDSVDQVFEQAIRVALKPPMYEKLRKLCHQKCRIL